MKVYSGYIKDSEKLLNSASGGVVTALSEKILQSGGVVFGVRYTADFNGAEYCCVENVERLEQLKGSKYTESIKGNVYKQVTEKLSEGKQVLFIGLGCDVGALRAYCKSNDVDEKNLYAVDILCHGPAAKGVHKSFVEELESKYESKLTNFTIRYKKDGWTPFYIKAEFENGKKHVEPFNESDYGKAFYRIARPSCTKCKFKGDNHKGDLCCGDFWGLTKDMPGWNPNGVSIMIVQTEKGNKLLQMLDDSFFIQEADKQLVLKGNPMYLESRQQKADYEKFIKDLNQNGLHFAVSQFPIEKPSLANYIKLLIKRFIKSEDSL